MIMKLVLILSFKKRMCSQIFNLNVFSLWMRIISCKIGINMEKVFYTIFNIINNLEEKKKKTRRERKKREKILLH